MLATTILIFLLSNVYSQAPAVGWAELYIIILLPVSLGLFLSFAIWEYKFAKSPIMPLHVFKAPSFLPLILVILLTLMAYSTSLWYMVAFQQNVRHWSPLHFAVGLSPHAVFGALAAPVAAWLIPRLAAQWILAFGCLTVLLSAVVLATMPEQQSYWIQVFPATILMSVCSDFILTAAQIIAAGAVSRKDQGVAASLVSVVQSVGAGIGLGVAGTVEAGLIDAGRNEVTSYRGALWLAAALAAVALPIDFLWVRVVKDERVGWGEDVVEVDARIKREATA
jgi:predicted MFS family arabinose efflux permease